MTAASPHGNMVLCSCGSQEAGYLWSRRPHTWLCMRRARSDPGACTRRKRRSRSPQQLSWFAVWWNGLLPV